MKTKANKSIIVITVLSLIFLLSCILNYNLLKKEKRIAEDAICSLFKRNGTSLANKVLVRAFRTDLLLKFRS